MQMPTYLTVTDAARLARVTRQRMHTLTKTGRIGTVRMLGRKYIRHDSLQSWMETRPTGPAAARQRQGRRLEYLG